MMMTIMMDRVWCWLLYLERIQTMTHEHHSDWLHLITINYLWSADAHDFVIHTDIVLLYGLLAQEVMFLTQSPGLPICEALGAAWEQSQSVLIWKLSPSWVQMQKDQPLEQLLLKYGKHGKLTFWSCLTSWTSQCLVLGEFQCLAKSRIWPKQLEAER